MFFKFPYTDLYTLNLDWMIKFLKEAQVSLEHWQEIIDSLGTIVHSVNGQTGDVNLGTLVNSVNGQTGDVNLGTLVNSVNGKTGAVEIDNDDINALKIEVVLQTTDPASTFTPAVVTPLFNSGIRFIIINNKDFYSITEAGAMIRFNPFEDLNISKELAQPPENQAEIEALYNQGIRFLRYAGTDLIKHYALEKINSVIVAYDLDGTNGANIFNFIDSNETIEDYPLATLQNMYSNGVRILFQDETNAIRKFYALLGNEVDGYTGYTEFDPVSYFDTQFVPSLQSDISALKNAMNILNENGYKTETEITWNQGRISPSTGGPVSADTTAVYSSTILADTHDVSFFATSTNAYTISLYEYTGYAWTDFVSVKLQGVNIPILFNVTPGRYYRIVIKKSDGTTLTPGDITNFTLIHHASEEYIVNTINDSSDNINDLRTNMDSIKENTENINTAGQGRYYITSAGLIRASSENYIGMPSMISIDEGYNYTVTVFNDGTTTTNGYYTAWYDESNNIIGTRQNINANAKYATFTAPEGAVKMAACIYNGNGVSADAKITITKGSAPANIYEEPVTAKDTVARNIDYIASNLISACNTSLNKKILTWIDDDTVKTAIPNVKSLCDTLGIKCTFACITSRLSDAELVTLLKSYQEAGYHIASHSHTHGTWYGENAYNADQIENDLILSLDALRENGFLDSDMLVYPGSSPSRTDVDVKAIAKKWCRCGVKASGTNFTDYSDGEYLINRQFFDASEHNTQYYIDLLDAFTANQAPWVVFGSHSGNTTEFDSAMINTVLTHAIENGWTVMTLNEALKYRQQYYNIKNIFGL